MSEEKKIREEKVITIGNTRANVTTSITIIPTSGSVGPTAATNISPRPVTNVGPTAATNVGPRADAYYNSDNDATEDSEDDSEDDTDDDDDYDEIYSKEKLVKIEFKTGVDFIELLIKYPEQIKYFLQSVNLEAITYKHTFNRLYITDLKFNNYQFFYPIIYCHESLGGEKSIALSNFDFNKVMERFKSKSDLKMRLIKVMERGGSINNRSTIFTISLV